MMNWAGENRENCWRDGHVEKASLKDGHVAFKGVIQVYAIMEIQTTETSESPTSRPVVSTETSETLEQLTPPVIAHPQTTETSEPPPPPPPVTNMPESEASLPEVTNTQTTESLAETHTPLIEVTNTHATEPSDDTDSTPPPVTNTQSTETLEQSILPPLTETKTTETIEQSVIPPVVTDNSHHDNLVSSPENHQVIETRQETAEEGEEIRSILKVIAATGKFCHDWEKLRSMLSLHLKQVISEYPQAKMTIEEQKVSLGETHAELVKRLDDALHSFVDGPPFTLQRLSEIILDARSLYPNLSKLALALEKNLSVTSTLTMSTDPDPQSLITTPNGLDKVTEDPNPNPNSNPNPNPNPNQQVESDGVMENGVLPATGVDRDEVMTEVEADVSDVMTMDMETYEKSSEESSPMTTGDS
ncbi:unnamed protein product [Lactuca saligna]|uniref:Uncharacterized protein n=1 Tax=Lactuca saligna TaxID=75948 RepID=A0AA35YK73_LACSI|nr:unnamed protein product [Lactuca saligna]